MKKKILFLCFLLGTSCVFGQGEDGVSGYDESKAVSTSFAEMEAEIDAETSAKYRKHIQEKVTQLTNYIAIIGNKDLNQKGKDRYDEELKTNSINQAVKLFVSEKNYMATSSINSSTIKKTPVRQYFNNLKTLSYRKVLIQFYEVHQISPLKKGKDGKHYATAYIFQLFEGYRADGEKYVDKTIKKIDITAETVINLVGDTQHELLVVKLGNINVEETKP